MTSLPHTPSRQPSAVRRAVARLGTGMLLGCLTLLSYLALWQTGIAPGTVAVAAPVALSQSGGARAVALSSEQVAAMQALSPVADQWSGDMPASDEVLPPVAEYPALPIAQAPAAPRFRPAYATHLMIPSINVDTDVIQAGLKDNGNGEMEWETVPFVAAHYGRQTALLGVPGNAVIAGHVLTLAMGNVFRDLNQVNLGDTIQVVDHRGDLHQYGVVEIKMVTPADTSVLAPTPDETLTLITCGGTFDPVSRQFSDRLIVVAKPIV